MAYWLKRFGKVLTSPQYLLWKVQTSARHATKAQWSRLRGHRAGSVRKVVMIHVGRSGSTVLADLLDQHPGIFWDGEIYETLARKNQAAAGSCGVSADSYLGYLESRFALAAGRTYGFEAKFFHLSALGASLTERLARIERLGVDHYVVLQRQNYLRKIISSVQARATTRWHQPSGVAAVKAAVHLDPARVAIDNKRQSLLEFMQEYDADFCALQTLLGSRKSLWLTYEDDLAESPLHACGRVLEFLELPPCADTKVRYGRTNPFPVRELLDNYEDVAMHLRGSKFEWMLER